MKPFYQDRDRTVYAGDNRLVLPALPSDFYDSCVTDPPAGIGFMNAAWDKDKGGRAIWIAWMTELMKEVLRTLKPGAHALVWALPRTSHWTATALEDAGFEIRDIVNHLFGTGFPKSKNVGGGRGTALKPAVEHWILCRKPLSEKTVEANVAEYGTGALNIDAARIPCEPIKTSRNIALGSSGAGIYGVADKPAQFENHPAGRWPANLILDEYTAQLLDEQTGELSVTGNRTAKSKDRWQEAASPLPGSGKTNRKLVEYPNEQGNPSRFFYVAKPSPAERNEGLESRSAVNVNDGRKTSIDNPYQRGDTPRHNTHPTVKPIELMRYLVRLITPKGGTVLDPFMGSGTTGIACELEGHPFVGIELDPAYCEIAVKRMTARCLPLLISSPHTETAA